MRRASLLAVTITALALPTGGMAQGPAPTRPPPPPPIQFPSVGGSTEFQDNWNSQAARPAARGFLTAGGGSTQAIHFDIVDLITCIFCVVPTGGGDHTKAKVADRPGTLTLRARTAGRCVAGARYPSMQLRLDGKDYQLGGVTIASCGAAASGGRFPTETVSFSYQSIELGY